MYNVVDDANNELAKIAKTIVAEWQHTEGGMNLQNSAVSWLTIKKSQQGFYDTASEASDHQLIAAIENVFIDAHTGYGTLQSAIIQRETINRLIEALGGEAE